MSADEDNLGNEAAPAEADGPEREDDEAELDRGETPLPPGDGDLAHAWWAL